MAKTIPPASDTRRTARRVKVKLHDGGAQWSCRRCYEFGWAHRFDIALAAACHHASTRWHAIATRPLP